MRLRTIVEKQEKEFFTYNSISDNMWRDKNRDAQKKFGISFDTENDEGIKQRTIVIDQKFWDKTKCKFNCELCSAGGDWQSPVRYFRVQLVDGYADGMSKYNDSYFCFIPGLSEGNPHLVKTKNGKLSAPDNEKTNKKPIDSKCWGALKKYLETLVKKEIANVKAGKT